MEGTQKTILVVEDEPPHLELLKRIFEGAGYRVLGAQDGSEAKEIYRQSAAEIDLVLCDMALPKLGGWTVYLSLKEINPRVKMILTSGYLDAKVKSDFVAAGVKDFIAKPYIAETILESVRQVLGSS